MRKISILIIALLLSGSASAHYIWIEFDGKGSIGKAHQFRIYYGEFNEGVREIKGGRLEEVAGIQCWVMTPTGKKIYVPVTISEKYYSGSYTPTEKGRHLVVAVNLVRDVVDWSKHDIGVVRPVYYATRDLVADDVTNEVTQDTGASLTISSTEKPNLFRLKFNGKPLASAKVLFHAPNEWSKELSTNASGEVEFNPLWKGQYVIECLMTEKVPGNFQGKNFEAVRHRSTLTVDVP